MPVEKLQQKIDQRSSSKKTTLTLKLVDPNEIYDIQRIHGIDTTLSRTYLQSSPSARRGLYGTRRRDRKKKQPRPPAAAWMLMPGQSSDLRSSYVDEGRNSPIACHYTMPALSCRLRGLFLQGVMRMRTYAVRKISLIREGKLLLLDFQQKEDKTILLVDIAKDDACEHDDAWQGRWRSVSIEPSGPD